MADYKKLFDLTGRKALVLGAAAGIGKASAEALGALGAEVHCAQPHEQPGATARRTGATSCQPLGRRDSLGCVVADGT